MYTAGSATSVKYHPNFVTFSPNIEAMRTKNINARNQPTSNPAPGHSGWTSSFPPPFWYQESLGLERKFEDRWGDEPAFLVANGSGIALFQAPDPTAEQPSEETIRPLHVAFRLNLKNFHHAGEELTARSIPFRYEDHNGVSRSIYFSDPDGHEIELTVYMTEMFVPSPQDEE